MLICKRGKDEEGVVDDRRSMHVQSHSEWAPANIGPYSQAYMVSVPDTNIISRKYSLIGVVNTKCPLVGMASIKPTS